MLTTLKTLPSYFLPFFLRPVRLLRTYDRRNLRSDLTAGLTVAVILLPQAIVFALIAGLPPDMGLYAAIVGAIVGALWGASSQIHNGPTSAVSLLVLSTASATAAVGSPEFLLAAGLLAVMVGVLQVVMGLARLGLLVNFVSDSVIVGFTAGAGIHIAVGELPHVFGVASESRDLVSILGRVLTGLPETHLPTFILGVGTVVLILIIRKLKPGLPAALFSLIAASLALLLFGLGQQGVHVMGRLPSSLPSLRTLPLNLQIIADLSTGALAIAAIGLIQTMAVAKSLAVQTGERLDSNQEFIGQGLANIACGLLSGYPVSGSFSRSAVNARAGARTPVAALFSGLFALAAMLALAPLTAYLPRAALSGVLIVVAYGMIDRTAMVRIVRGTYGEAAIMAVTLLGTLLLPIEFAVLAGILMALGYYILQTSAPQVHAVLPDEAFRHLAHQPKQPHCPQLGILDIHGDLYFGATAHVEDAIRAHMARHPEQRFLLLRLHGVNHCDFSGIRMIEGVVHRYRDKGGDVFMTRVRQPVHQFMRSTGFYQQLGSDHFLSPDDAIEHLFYRVLDPAICIYESDVRVFRECQNLPRPDYPVDIPVYTDIPAGTVSEIAPETLWEQLREDGPHPLVIDVREPREFKRGHISGARLIPLPTLLSKPPDLPEDRRVVLVCRSGRRSTRAAYQLRDRGRDNVIVLGGGMRAWDAAGLLEAVEETESPLSPTKRERKR